MKTIYLSLSTQVAERNVFMKHTYFMQCEYIFSSFHLGSTFLADINNLKEEKNQQYKARVYSEIIRGGGV